MSKSPRTPMHAPRKGKHHHGYKEGDIEAEGTTEPKSDDLPKNGTDEGNPSN